jgi:hypothetical protein
MDENELSLKLDCPTCGATPQERCQMSDGAPRFISHVARWDFVKDRVRKGTACAMGAHEETAQG